MQQQKKSLAKVSYKTFNLQNFLSKRNFGTAEVSFVYLFVWGFFHSIIEHPRLERTQRNDLVELSVGTGA